MHTKEPWSIFTPDDYVSGELPTLGIDGANGEAVVWHSHIADGGIQDDEDARRIVACVNACAGMDDPEDHITLLEDNANDAGMYKQQRDELLAALKDARASFSLAYDCAEKKFNDECLLHIGVGGARADKVIAKCES